MNKAFDFLNLLGSLIVRALPASALLRQAGLYVTPASPSKVFPLKLSGEKRFGKAFLKKRLTITPNPNASGGAALCC